MAHGSLPTHLPPRQNGWLWRAMRYLVAQGWRGSPRHLIALCVLGILRSLLPVSNLALLVLLINSLVRVVGGDLSSSLGAVVALAGQAIVQMGMTWLNESFSLLQRRMDVLLRFQREEAFIDKLLQLEVCLLEEPALQEVMARIRVSVTSQTGGGGSNLISFLAGICTFVLLIVFCAEIYWLTGLLITGVGLILIMIHLQSGRSRFTHRVHITSASREVEYWIGVLLNPFTAIEIRSFSFGPWLKDRWQRLFLHMIQEEAKVGVRQDKMALLAQWIGALTSLGISGLLLWLLMRGQLSVGAFVGGSAVVAMAVNSTQQLAQSFSSFYDEALGLDEFIRFTEIDVQLCRQAVKPLSIVQGAIHLRNVTFRYPGTTRPAIDALTCTIPIGKRVLIVGPNGAGKSTVIKLIAGLYQPQTGEVFYDDLTGQIFSTQTLGLYTSSLFQGYHYYDTTVRENIGIGDIGRLDRLDEIQQAATIAHAEQFIARWPDAYEARLGRWLWEDGQLPSQGQRLRLALARTIFKRAQIYILDEPTAGLDPETEELVVQELDQFTKGKTTIFISHSPHLARMADHVIVLMEGRVLEEGPPHLLLNSGGWFASSYWHQVNSTEMHEPQGEASNA